MERTTCVRTTCFVYNFPRFLFVSWKRFGDTQFDSSNPGSLLCVRYDNTWHVDPSHDVQQSSLPVCWTAQGQFGSFCNHSSPSFLSLPHVRATRHVFTDQSTSPVRLFQFAFLRSDHASVRASRTVRSGRVRTSDGLVDLLHLLTCAIGAVATHTCAPNQL